MGMLERTALGLERLEQQLAASQQQLAASQPRLIGWIRLATLLVILLLLWSFAGQFALARAGWQALGG
jgi:hypothetical protein